jgi:hypothetical protein
MLDAVRLEAIRVLPAHVCIATRCTNWPPSYLSAGSPLCYSCAIPVLFLCHPLPLFDRQLSHAASEERYEQTAA